MEVPEVQVKRPEVYFENGNVPSFQFSGTLEVGDPSNTEDNIRVDALQVTNLTTELKDYYRSLFKDDKTQALMYSNNRVYMFITRDSKGTIRVYATPDSEITPTEHSHIEDLIEKGTLFNGSAGESVPFSTFNSAAGEAYRKSLNAFSKPLGPFARNAKDRTNPATLEQSPM